MRSPPNLIHFYSICFVISRHIWLLFLILNLNFSTVRWSERSVMPVMSVSQSRITGRGCVIKIISIFVRSLSFVIFRSFEHFVFFCHLKVSDRELELPVSRILTSGPRTDPDVRMLRVITKYPIRIFCGVPLLFELFIIIIPFLLFFASTNNWKYYEIYSILSNI